MVYIPFCNVYNEHALEEPKTNGVISYRIGRTPHVEGLNMVGRILSRNTLKIWYV